MKRFLTTAAVSAMLFTACGDDTSSNAGNGSSRPTGDDVFSRTGTLYVNESEHILAIALENYETQMCVVEEDNYTWKTVHINNEPDSMMYDFRGDTLVLYDIYHGQPDTEYGELLVGGTAGSLYGTWTFTGCEYDKDDDETECYEKSLRYYHRSITFSCANDVKRDRSGNAVQERPSCFLLFLFDNGQHILFFMVYFHHRFRVQLVYRSRSTFSDHFTAVHIDSAELFPDRDDRVEAGHLKHLVDFRRDIPDRKARRAAFSEFYHDTKACTGDIDQFVRIKANRQIRMEFYFPEDLSFNLAGVCVLDPFPELYDQFVFLLTDYHFHTPLVVVFTTTGKTVLCASFIASTLTTGACRIICLAPYCFP